MVSPIDPRRLRPFRLAQLINSTPLGEVINERQIHRHRTRAGMQLGGRTVDLIAYTAWLARQRHEPKEKTPAQTYDEKRDAARKRNADLSRVGRDIGPLPEVVNPERRAAAEDSFRCFCETYFGATFHLPWSDDHLKVIEKIEQAVLEGGLFAYAMPRGSGKTSLCEAAAMWSIMIGAREFVCLIGSSEDHALEMLEAIKTELEVNELLLEDFPEVVFPIQRLEGITHRANGQLLDGERTHIGWTAKELIMPMVAGSKAAGAIIRAAGITGRIRGMKSKTADGESIRPSLVIVDDPQTDESARSLSQCESREAILAGAVLGLAGPGRKISGIMPVTVIQPDDMADRILNRDKHPEWQGERTRMVYTWPTNAKLWEEYAALRADGFRDGDRGAAGTEFYSRHRADMDAGAQIAWAARFNHDEISAVQHAWNLRLDQGEAAFAAEYQNEPLSPQRDDADLLTIDQIAEKQSGTGRGIVPLAATHLTAFIDVQQRCLYYAVAAWSDDFTGWIIDYGTYPDQKKAYFTLRDVQRTLARAKPGAGFEGALFAGLEKLTDQLLGRDWRREDGSSARIERCLIDANWGASTDVVYQFCRESAHRTALMPSHGRGVSAAMKPLTEYQKRPGDRLGQNWYIPNPASGKRGIHHFTYDTNWWKSFVHARLAVPMGDRGCLSLFKAAPSSHRLIAEQLAAEYRVRTQGRGRTVDEWKLKPNAENHLLDCVVGCAAAASVAGCRILGHPDQAVRAAGSKRRRAVVVF